MPGRPFDVVPLVSGRVREQVSETHGHGHHDPGREVIAIDERPERRRAFIEWLPAPVHEPMGRRVLRETDRREEQTDRRDAAGHEPDAASHEHLTADDEDGDGPCGDAEGPHRRPRVDAERQRAANGRQAQALPDGAIGRREPIDDRGRQRDQLQRDGARDHFQPQVQGRGVAGPPPWTVARDENGHHEPRDDERRGVDAGEKECRAGEQEDERGRAPFGAALVTPRPDSVRSSSCTGSRSSESSSTCCG